MKLPLTDSVRFSKLLAAIRNYEKFSPAKLHLLLNIYSVYRQVLFQDLLKERMGRKYPLRDNMKSYRPELLVKMSNLQLR